MAMTKLMYVYVAIVGIFGAAAVFFSSQESSDPSTSFVNSLITHATATGGLVHVGQSDSIFQKTCFLPYSAYPEDKFSLFFPGLKFVSSSEYDSNKWYAAKYFAEGNIVEIYQISNQILLWNDYSSEDPSDITDSQARAICPSYVVIEVQEGKRVPVFKPVY